MLKKMFIILINCFLLGYIESLRISYDILKNVSQDMSMKPFDSYLDMTDLEESEDFCDDFRSEECAEKFIKSSTEIEKRNVNRMMNVAYKYTTDINEMNYELRVKFYLKHNKISNKILKKLRKFKWENFQSLELKRIFYLLTPTIESKNETISEMITKTSNKIEDIYNNAEPCFKRCLAKGEKEITDYFEKEKDYDKLSGYWSSWREKTGRKIKDLFVKKMNLENIGAKENGYSDTASFNLRKSFEEDNFQVTILRLYEEILPLYQQLHAYVRHCLALYYPGRFNITGAIPAHILGNLWAQNWNNLFPIIQKCRNREFSFNIQKEVNKSLQNISVKTMFKIAEGFYDSLGMFKMTSNFWERSIITKDPKKHMNCHATAHDFYNNVDFRISMCSTLNINDFTTIHHEMGHIEYYSAYRNQNLAFKNAPNPGFHEAIGDTVGLSVTTPKHLQRIGLISKTPESEYLDIDYLLLKALEKVAFLPYALTMDSYIWSVYNGSVPYDKLNEHWWNLRFRYQGLKPPNERTENDFDAGGKYHIAFGISYIRYFASNVHQFQFYEAMCKLSGHSGLLHRCDFYNSKKAGEKLIKMLEKGRSQHWRESLEILTSDRDISSLALMKYFKPLHQWLKHENERLKIQVGW